MHFSAVILMVNCDLWPWLLIPLLLLSWFLGWLLRGGGRKYKDRIEGLEQDLRRVSGKNTGMEKEISALRFDYNKMSGENKDLRNNLADSNNQIGNWRKKYSVLETEKSDWESTKLLGGNQMVNEGPSQEDLNKLESELNNCRNKLSNTESKLSSLENDLAAKTRTLEELKAKMSNTESDYRVSQDKLSATEKALAECESKTSSLEASKTSRIVSDAPRVDKTSTNIVTPLVSNTPVESPKEGIGVHFESTNLQIIEGVGPKIEGLLKAAGYNSWADIAGSNVSDLQKVLENAGPRYRIHNPQKWSDQAGFAANGQWEKLIQYQKDIDGGDGGQSKAEKLYFKAIGFAASKPNDLKVVEGIGPKIEGLLKNAGIDNWSDLASSSVENLQTILFSAGDRYRLADPKTWPKQAELAAAGKWTELKEYQDFLQGGRE